MNTPIVSDIKAVAKEIDEKHFVIFSERHRHLLYCPKEE
jgi:hypothetical protein